MRLRRELEASLREDPEVQGLLDEVVARRLDPASAASAILARGRVEAGDAARPDQQATDDRGGWAWTGDRDGAEAAAFCGVEWCAASARGSRGAP